MKPIIGFALCGSFCTFRKALDALRLLARNYTVIPIASEASAQTDTRFGAASDFLTEIEQICGTGVLTRMEEVEPFGPKKQLELLVIAPCTGNTLAKLSAGIADTAVTLACKAHLRNGRPVVLAVSSNDALAANAESIGRLLARRNFYFVPFGQDSPNTKPGSLVADFSKLPETVAQALAGRQLQPLLLGSAT